MIFICVRQVAQGGGVGEIFLLREEFKARTTSVGGLETERRAVCLAMACLLLRVGCLCPPIAPLEAPRRLPGSLQEAPGPFERLLGSLRRLHEDTGCLWRGFSGAVSRVKNVVFTCFSSVFTFPMHLELEFMILGVRCGLCSSTMVPATSRFPFLICFPA